MAYVNRNIDNASQLKLWPGIIFSSELEQYINDLADIHGVHPDSLAIILLNCAAATLEGSYVLRANRLDGKISTNLFNMIVARSSYGKSELTKVLREMLKVVVLNRPNKFRTNKQIAAGDTVNPTLDEMSKAGLLTAVNGCCRTVVCDEADITFADIGLFHLPNLGRVTPDANCRTLVLTLYDQTTQTYIRKTANKEVSVSCSKLNILGCSTGDIISSIIVRAKAECNFDAMIGRFLFWPLDGPVIPDKIIQRQIDYTKMGSLNQFAIILSFIENIIFNFEEDAVQEIVSWGNDCKTKSYELRNTDICSAARLGKIIQIAYRVVALVQTIEIAFIIYRKYLEDNNHFPANGIIDVNYVESIEDLFHSNFPRQFATNAREPFQINKNVTLHALDLISGNMRQFQLLFDSTNAPKWSSLSRQVVVVAPDQYASGRNNQPFIEHNQVKQEKRQQKYIYNFNAVAAAVILFPSICFTKKQLHTSSVIHNNSSGGLLKEVLAYLVKSKVLAVCQRGVKNKSGSTAVYIKKLCNENDDEEDMSSILSEYAFEKKPITFEIYRNSCQIISLKAVGVVQDDVFETLRRPEYGDLDLTPLTSLPKTSAGKDDGSRASIFGADTESSALDIDIDRNLYFDFEQEITDTMSSQLTESSTQNDNRQLKDSSATSFLVPGNSDSTTSNTLPEDLENIQLTDAIKSDNGSKAQHVIQQSTQEEDELMKLLCKDNQNNELPSDNFVPLENVQSNDGFTSPTAWKTRSHQKNSKEITTTEENVVPNQAETSSGSSSTAVVECQETNSSINFSPGPPSRRTRAKVKRSVDNVADKSKTKLGSKRFRKN